MNYTFASDNCAGVCPEAAGALERAAEGFVPGYGDDAYTARAADAIRDVFETDCDVYFCFNGTAANSMALGHLCKSYHSVICHEAAHIETDECGGPEFFTHGTKLLLVAGPLGKIETDHVERMIRKREDIHYPKPRVLSLTQATELGTVYDVDELRALGHCAKAHGLHVHMDGARFANAAAALGVAPRAITWEAGVDVLCFGGTKNGMAVGEAVVFFDRDLAVEFDRRCKQAGQLASKMRFLAAPWVDMLEGGAWLRHARHANDCAAALRRRIARLGRIELPYPTQANSVFARLTDPQRNALAQRGWKLYGFIGGATRIMCSWATTQQDIDALMNDIEAVT